MPGGTASPDVKQRGGEVERVERVLPVPVSTQLLIPADLRFAAQNSGCSPEHIWYTILSDTFMQSNSEFGERRGGLCTAHKDLHR